MRSRIAWFIVALLTLAAAFGAGIFAQRQIQLSQVRVAREFARGFVGANTPVAAAPRWPSWHYPGADARGQIEGTSIRVTGELFRPAGHYGVFVTPDAFEKVVAFYARRAEFPNADDVPGSTLATSSHGTIQGESHHLLDDFHPAGGADVTHTVQSKCLIRRCPSFDLTVFISRAAAGPQTHIVLVYDPKTEPAAEEGETSADAGAAPRP